MQSQDLPFHFSYFLSQDPFFLSCVFIVAKNTNSASLNVGIKACAVVAIPGMLGDAPEASLVSWDLH